jgi:hypothetical protein
LFRLKSGPAENVHTLNLIGLIKPVWTGVLAAQDSEDRGQELDPVGKERHSPVDVAAKNAKVTSGGKR